MMSTEEAVAALDAMNTEPEQDHGEADNLLLQLVAPEVRAAYERLMKRSA